jgi:hypothetical protein
MTTRGIYLVVSILLTSCVALSGRSQAIESTWSSDAQIYTAILHELFRESSSGRLIIAGCTQPWAAYGGPGPGLGFFRDVIPGLDQETIDGLVSETHGRRLPEGLSGALPLHFIEPGDPSCMTKGSTVEEFQSQYPDASGFFSFSPVGISANGQEALVHAWYWCGGRCGNGTLVGLTRVNGDWRVTASARTAVH